MKLDKPYAAEFVCPMCDGNLTVIVDFKAEGATLYLKDPRIVIDRHLEFYPNCDLQNFVSG